MYSSNNTDLVEEAHHLHEGGRIALLARDALNLGFDSLQERVQVLQHLRHLRTQQSCTSAPASLEFISQKIYAYIIFKPDLTGTW